MSHADHEAAHELSLYIENDGQLHRQQGEPILKNLILKVAKRTYDHDNAVKLYMYLMESGAKKYCKEFGGTWNVMFSVPTRKLAAEEFAKSFEAEAALGNYAHLLPKKYQKETPAKKGKARR